MSRAARGRNGYAESFHGKLRDELLNAELFAELQAVAKKYMTKDRLFRFVAMPKTTGTPTTNKKAPGPKRSLQSGR